MKSNYVGREDFYIIFWDMVSLILIFRFSWAARLFILKIYLEIFLELRPIVYLRQKIALLKEKLSSIKQIFIPKTDKKLNHLKT